MDAPDQSSIDRLSPRMRECLRLAYDRKTNKQIAAALGLEEGTIKGYIADAVRLLGARGKVDAAERLHAAEHTVARLYEPICPPSIVPPPFVGVVEDQPCPPSTGSPAAPLWRHGLPIRLRGEVDNDLSIRQRLVWIVALAVAFAIGIGAVANTLHVVDQFVRGR